MNSNTNYDQQVKDAQIALDNAKNAQREQEQSASQSSTPVKVHVGLVDALIAFFQEHKQQFINLPALVATCEDIIGELEGAKSDARGVDTTTSPTQNYQPSYTPTGVTSKPNYYDASGRDSTNYDPAAEARAAANTPVAGSQGPDYNRYGVGSPSTSATSGTNGGGTGVGAPFESNTAGASSFDGNTNVGGPTV